MTPDLTVLLWTVILTFAEIVVAAIGANTQVSMAVLVGNRENMPALTGWAGRAQRAHRNMQESLPLFIALVAIAHIAGKTTPTIMLGAELFFWGRVAHWLIYLAGIPYLRTLAWMVSIAGLVVIVTQLV